jgi:flagellar biosynthesis GTPase FlhF
MSSVPALLKANYPGVARQIEGSLEAARSSSLTLNERIAYLRGALEYVNDRPYSYIRRTQYCLGHTDTRQVKSVAEAKAWLRRKSEQFYASPSGEACDGEHDEGTGRLWWFVVECKFNYYHVPFSTSCNYSVDEERVPIDLSHLSHSIRSDIERLLSLQVATERAAQLAAEQAKAVVEQAWAIAEAKAAERAKVAAEAAERAKVAADAKAAERAKVAAEAKAAERAKVAAVQDAAENEAASRLRVDPYDNVYESVGQKPRACHGFRYVRDVVHADASSPAFAGVARSKEESRKTLQFDKAYANKVIALYKRVNAGACPSRELLNEQIHLEEAQQRHDIRAYDIFGARLNKAGGGAFVVPCPGLIEQRPSVLRGDAVFARDRATNRKHKGYVTACRQTDVLVSFDDARLKPNGNSKYDIIFSAPKRPFDLQRRAVRDARYLLEPRLLRPNTVGTALLPGVKDRKHLIRELKAHGVWGTLDDSQQQFVATFLRARSAVNLLHGPPGTGKTTTVVGTLRALFELEHLRYDRVKGEGRSMRILVCTPSNKSADLVLQRFVADTPRDKRRALLARIMRVNAASRSWSEVPEDVRPYCDASDNSFPDRDAVNRRDLVVSTLSTAGTLYGIGADPFDLLIVDEAGQCTEAELLVALCMLAFEEGHGRARVVLAGDHLQLGPQVRNALCRKTHLHWSPLQRLMTAANKETRPELMCATMLRHNYRAHPGIVALYNPTYGGQLHAAAHSDVKTLQVSRRVAPWFSQGPVCAVHVDGAEAQEADSPSWKNDEEARAVVRIVRSLLAQRAVTPEQIVVLSGYAKQCSVIRKLLTEFFYHSTDTAGYALDANAKVKYQGKCPVTVCSVEKFQGSEAPVVIMSCVRSRNLAAVRRDMYIGLGFLSNRQRVNVGISRAIAGLAIVGNLNLLACDPEWRRVITTASQEGGLLSLELSRGETAPAGLTMEKVLQGAAALEQELDCAKIAAEAALGQTANAVLPAQGEAGADLEWQRRE